jgi:Zn-dependent metalloprotease
MSPPPTIPGNNKAAVSAHYNATRAYEYFLQTHGHNSVNGRGGNIISFINVAEDDGSSMENAFWNGQAAFYGNGGQYFKPLAGALDVTAHELDMALSPTPPTWNITASLAP